VARVDEQQAPGADQQLRAWLAERARDFDTWARETGLPDRWDFTPGSLDVLEDLVRSRYPTEEELGADRASRFLQGAIWYVGETACRRDRLVWHYWPFDLDGGTPDLFGVDEPGIIDTPSVGKPRAREGKGTDPWGLLRSLYWDMDEIDRPLETHLRDIVR
jgi:hypothetical protein